jgi:SnoaL-like domain
VPAGVFSEANCILQKLSENSALKDDRQGQAPHLRSKPARPVSPVRRAPDHRNEADAMPSQKTLDDFVALVVSGKHDVAIERFYTEDASMQDNLGDIRKGRDNLVARERAFMGRFKEIRTTCVKPVFVSGNFVVIHWIFEFVRAEGGAMRIEELAHQRWQGEKIAEERFYYDPSQMK